MTLPKPRIPPESVVAVSALARLPVAELPAIIAQMINRPDDANRYMNLSRLFSVVGNQDFALEMQTRALQMSTVYRIASTIRPAIRLLALMGAGAQSVNTPLDYLVENSDIQLDLLYITPEQPQPACIPEHDVAIVALGESDDNRHVLEIIERLTENWHRPILNPARHVLNNSRDGVYQRLKDSPGLLIPPTHRISRADLTRVANMQLAIDKLIDGTYPITIRPLVSQGGRGLARIHNAAELSDYLNASGDTAFFISLYIDYRSADGLYRKARIALIDGIPCICHLAISENWVVHFGSSNMTDSVHKRGEEAQFMSNFDTGFASRHRAALKVIADKLELDYVVIDCAETKDGELLLFEADNRGWVHATDSIELFPYKQTPMNKVFTAFRTLLLKKMANTQ